MLLRRLVGPLTLWNAHDGWRWEGDTTTELLDGLVHHVASPTGFEPVFWP